MTVSPTAPDAPAGPAAPAALPPRPKSHPLRAASLTAAALVILLVAGLAAGIQLGVVPNPLKLTVSEVAAKVRPAVVTVRATVFRDGTTEGTGFYYLKKSHLLTSAHILARATHIDVVQPDGLVTTAALVGIDQTADVAELLTFDLKTVPLLPAQEGVTGGTQVVVMGDPQGTPPKAYGSGHVAATGRELTESGRSYKDLIQTDAPAKPEDSGSPMVDMSGKLVGMVSESGGKAYAVPLKDFDSEARSWAREDNEVRLGPPPVTGTSASLPLKGVPLSGFSLSKNEPWGGTGVHLLYQRPPDYTYGGASVDIYLNVAITDANAGEAYLSQIDFSKSKGFTVQGSTTDTLGDQATALQLMTSDEVAFEIVWTDRNAYVDMFLSSGMPPQSDIAMATLAALTQQQEVPIAASLANYQ